MSSAKERREARKADLESQRLKQEEKDFEELDAIETRLGDSNVSYVEIPFTPGLPTIVVVRTPKPSEIKRFRDTIKQDPKGRSGDQVKAAQQLAVVCLEYPDKETYAQIVEARPGVDTQLGAAALQLSVGSVANEGKE